MVRRLPGMREVPGSNPLRVNNLCTPNPLEETINLDPNTYHYSHIARIDLIGIKPKVVCSVIVSI